MSLLTKSDNQNTKQTLQLRLDYRLLSLLLLLTIGAMLLVWKPWSSTSASDQVIKVTGESKLTAEPDEFVFYPTYQFKSSDKTQAIAELTKKSEEVVGKLKGLGVEDRRIKTNTSGYDYPAYYPEKDETPTYTLSLTITVGSREEATKVQDYLVTTVPTGAVSPSATFSQSKRTELETKARDEATKSARTKAEQSARNLGFKLGRVKSVEDGSGFGIGPYPLAYAEDVAGSPRTEQQKLNIQPGENDLNYSVTVTYFVR